jgi:hypothetical protein
VNNQDIKKTLDAINKVSADRHKLIIILGMFGAGKTQLLKQVADLVQGRYININLELSERLLQLPARDASDGVTVHRLIDDICDSQSPNGEPLLVDNIEILFSPELGKVNPVDTFKRVSRQRPIVLAMPALRQGNMAVYSTPDHPDYFPISLEDYIVIEL